jgi:hypothetical protein
MAEKNFNHGCYAYQRHKCRCDICRAANTENCRQSRANAKARAKRDPRLIPHGTVVGYGYWGCSCSDCRKANAENQKKYPAKKRKDNS